MRGSSVHFKRIASAIHAVSHASRDVPPEYLLPEGMSLGTHVVIDDHGQVQKLLEHKMHLASRQAKATKDYSPMWEGVINLPEPSPDLPPARQVEIVKAWCVEYEKMTGHKVIRADVHLDEGFVDEAGKPHFNAHAHVMCDRTDDKGRVKKLTSTVLREVQNMTANVTTLQRGLDARQTHRKHVGHQNFRFDAEKNRLDLDKEKSKTARIQKLYADDTTIISSLKAKLAGEPARLDAALKAQEAKYRLDREVMKASGTAKQPDYQKLKKDHEAELAKLKKERDDAVAENKQLKIDAIKNEAEIYQLKQVIREANDSKKEGDEPALFLPGGEAPTTDNSFVVLTIKDTSTAAFEDIGRNQEAARIVRDAAAIIEEEWDGKPFDLQDTNGNKVGQFEAVEVAAIGALPKLQDGGIRLVMAKNKNLVSVMKLVATKLQTMVKAGTERIKDAVGTVIAQLTVRPPVPPAELDQNERPKGP